MVGVKGDKAVTKTATQNRTHAHIRDILAHSLALDSDATLMLAVELTILDSCAHLRITPLSHRPTNGRTDERAADYTEAWFGPTVVISGAEYRARPEYDPSFGHLRTTVQIAEGGQLDLSRPASSLAQVTRHITDLTNRIQNDLQARQKQFGPLTLPEHYIRWLADILDVSDGVLIVRSTADCLQASVTKLPVAAILVRLGSLLAAYRRSVK